ncbi:MAG: hypothetical protein LRY71_14755 [Bacillaceae bacterium]|nr:hypothetical protein [Bacillaceae bacterium]
MQKKITVIVNTDSVEYTNTIKIPRQLYHSWKLKEEDAVQLSIGNKTILTRCKTSNEKHIIQISKQIAKELCIPLKEIPIHCLFDFQERKITLGPVVTCVTSVKFDERHHFII